jgi:hypothetical protein
MAAEQDGLGELERARQISGELSVHEFDVLHFYCEGYTILSWTENSAEADPATSDLRPVFKQRGHCPVDEVDSVTEETPGV